MKQIIKMIFILSGMVSRLLIDLIVGLTFVLILTIIGYIGSFISARMRLALQESKQIIKNHNTMFE